MVDRAGVPQWLLDEAPVEGRPQSRLDARRLSESLPYRTVFQG